MRSSLSEFDWEDPLPLLTILAVLTFEAALLLLAASLELSPLDEILGRLCDGLSMHLVLGRIS